MPKKPPQHPRKRACAECDRFMAALQKERREHIKAIGLQIADRDALSEQVEKAEADLTAALANCEEQRRRADKWIAGSERNIEWEDLNKERAKIEDERDRYRILRDAASEASLRRDADCLAIRTERDKVIDEMNNLIVKYNLPVLLRGSCGRSRSGAGGERKG